MSDLRDFLILAFVAFATIILIAIVFTAGHP